MKIIEYSGEQPTISRVDPETLKIVVRLLKELSQPIFFLPEGTRARVVLDDDDLETDVEY